MRISEVVRRTVVFFGTSKEGVTQFRGTGFLVTYTENDYGFGYVVTARHVAQKINQANNAVVRLNTSDGGSHLIDVEDTFAWTYHPDPTVDVAVRSFHVNQAEYAVAYYKLADLVRPTDASYRVQCGDPICIVGLFHLHSGTRRNIPIVHSGNIALLPDSLERIPVIDQSTGKVIGVEAYLVEAQTLEGLSGAPVFQREVVALRQFPEHNGGLPLVTTGAQLLGVYSAAWAGYPSEILADDKRLGPDKRVPVGMGIVMPGERIWEIIANDEELRKVRAEFLKMRDEQKSHKSIDQKSSGDDVAEVGPKTD